MARESRVDRSSSGGIAGAIILAAITAAIGYAVSYISDYKKNELDVANAQIEKLYGPLYAYSTAADKAHSNLREFYRPNSAHYFNKNDDDRPSPIEVETWRRWMKIVFLPLDQKMESTIIDNVQLIGGQRIFPLFGKLIVHVESYKAVVANWKDSDDLLSPDARSFAANNALVEYPIGLDDCIQLRYDTIIERRNRIEKSLTGFFIGESSAQFPEGCF
jgi:hypothetical protein